jgi:hypothetical protein
MTTTQVVLIDQTKSIDPVLMHHAALSLNTQVTQHLPKYWDGINASVSSAPRLAALPRGAWPVFLVKSLPPGEGGFHLDKNNQPYAKVIASPTDDTWTIDAAHEICEMLVDPFGNRMKTSQAIAIEGSDVIDAKGVFNYLVEACDPCEASNFAYEINGIAVTDFITPHFYDVAAMGGVQYSFTGSIKRPRQLLPGGYISYIAADGQWQQILWVDPNAPPQYKDPTIPPAPTSLRLAVHSAMGNEATAAKHAQRRKKDGLGTPVRERVMEYAAHRKNLASYEEHLVAHYKL